MCFSETLVPKVGVIVSVFDETPDVKTFRVSAPGGGVLFSHMPGQCAMLSAPGVGEAMFSIASSPTNTEFMDFSIKKAGVLTEWLHFAEVSQQITVRGPYGRAFPVDSDLKGKDLLFIAGGIGIAPLRSVINYVRDNRANYGAVDIVYGARSADNLVFRNEMVSQWVGAGDIDVHVTIDSDEDDWSGNVGFVPDFVRALNPSPDKMALVCGPPVMIKFTLAALKDLGFDFSKAYTTLEMRMKCGIGKCGRCNIGSKYVCIDGPVFRCDELDDLPDEY